LARCAFIKPGGDRCGATAMRGYDTCYGHRPDLAEERRHNASKGGKRGGRGRPGRNLSEIDRTLRDMIAGVLTGDEDKKVGHSAAVVVIQACNARLRLVEVERKIKETEELEARLESLEEAFGVQGGGRTRWGV
jgi:hypothetical protein